jgi:hypothetical protein
MSFGRDRKAAVKAGKFITQQVEGNTIHLLIVGKEGLLFMFAEFKELVDQHSGWLHTDRAVVHPRCLNRRSIYFVRGRGCRPL